VIKQIANQCRKTNIKKSKKNNTERGPTQADKDEQHGVRYKLRFTQILHKS